MYKQFYHLTAKPFESSPDPQFLFLSKQHREVLSSLLYGIESAKGFILIAGGIGTGKTTLVRTLLQEINPAHIILNIVNPKTNFDEIFSHLAQKLEISINGKNKLECIDLVREKLVSLAEEGRRVVVLIDEAHLLSDESLEEIRLISNIEDDKTKLIQIILVGQNELYPLLDRAEQKPLKQRIVINRKLVPLDRKESREYILHRLKVAGRTRKLFKDSALSLICTASGGTPRLINQICDNALLIGYALESKHIDARIIKEVLSDMETAPKRKPFFSSTFFISGLAAGVLVALTAYYFLEFRAPVNNGPSPPPLFGQATQPAEDTGAFASPRIIDKEDIARQLDSIRSKVRQEASTACIKPTKRPGRKVPVKKRERLSTIAEKEYGSVSDTIIDLIQAANPRIKNIHHIYSGQNIILPEITRDSLITEAGGGIYLIHYASFYSSSIAKKATMRLLSLGREAFIDSSQQGENKVYRIYIGPFSNKEKAGVALESIYLHNLLFLNDGLSP